MSVYIDRKYLKLVSPQLKKFCQKKEDLYNFRCPFCGDSQKNLNKARGYVYRKKNDYFYKCQNCGVGKNMYNFIESLDANLVQEYTMERYKDGQETKIGVVKPSFSFPQPTFKRGINLPKISELDESHPARKYVEDRKIPEQSWNKLFFCTDFKKFVGEVFPGQEKTLKPEDSRLVIPFFDAVGNLISVQGRTLGDSKLRYITIKAEGVDTKIFGLYSVNLEEKIYVTEGPLDSLFLNNAVATADSNLTNAVNYLPKDKLVLVFDNEPRNKEIVKLMDRAIEDHFQICIWPEMIEEKDINEMILSGFSKEEICDIIEKNTFLNLRAKMEFVQWKKV